MFARPPFRTRQFLKRFVSGSSALVGLIWQLRDGLSVDVGLRHALTNGRPGNEVRAGVTYGFPLRALDARTAQYR